ncbi:MAG: M23 family metallopeptidase, partial [Muribaculaceae bacterium]|nr:M23 family metallopeptidase [Muribaculaceae bacterium]
VVAGSFIVMLTPLHTLLPGYLKENQRSATEENLLRLDSLRNVYETNQRFIDNYLRITDTDRFPLDSTILNKADSLPKITDSLMLPSKRESMFVAKMEEQERFNISVLAPLAADGMLFSNISDSGIFTSASKDSEVGEVILPEDASLLCVSDGTVIACYYSHQEKGYVIIIQHQRGFASRYSHVGNPLVVMDEDVEAGQIIASPPSPDNSGKRTAYIRMWHNGLPIVPYRFIHDNNIENRIDSSSPANSFDAPRGR